MSGPLWRLLLLAALWPWPLLAAEVELDGGLQRLVLDLDSGLPRLWETCDRPCRDPAARRMTLVGPGAGTLAWRGPVAAAGGYDAQLGVAGEESIQAVLRPVDGSGAVLTWELSTRVHRARLTLPAGATLEQRVGPSFQPEALPGFGAAFSDIERVRLTPDGQEELATAAVTTGEWGGLRQRFWAWLARAEAGLTGRAAVEPRGMDWEASASARLEFYAGPVQWQALASVDGALTALLFPRLWEPLRWLCRALYEILAVIQGFISNPGLAIILLSLVVKILLAPLTAIADRWQRQVNIVQSRLQPKLAAIKASHRGEEAHRLELAAYRDEGVSPLFTLKSLAGFAIQVPMFIAAFDMLADNIALSGASFLWIDDLAAPDRFAALPAALPFFGSHFNLMPALMTAVTLLSAWIQRDDSLNAVLQLRQRRQLYAMAAAFFLLFYTFPAGMVLYWTANNVWHLLKLQALQSWRALIGR